MRRLVAASAGASKNVTVVAVAAIMAVAYVLNPRCDVSQSSKSIEIEKIPQFQNHNIRRAQPSGAQGTISESGLCGDPDRVDISTPVAPGKCTSKLNEVFQSAIADVNRGRMAGRPDDVLEWLSEGADCPERLLFGWRQYDSLVPLILGTKCEPWWRREAIVIMDRVLTGVRKLNADRGRRTVGVEWGGGSSSIWISKRIDKLWVVESSDMFFSGMNATAQEHGVWKTRMDGCKRDAHKRHATGCDAFTDVKFAEMPNPHSVDFISVDSTACREKIMNRRVQELLVPDGGVLVVDNSDRYPNALQNLPSHWLRYDTPSPWPSDWKLPCLSDSAHWKKHGMQAKSCENAATQGMSKEADSWPQLNRTIVNRWIKKDNLQTTIWITRSADC